MTTKADACTKLLKLSVLANSYDHVLRKIGTEQINNLLQFFQAAAVYSNKDLSCVNFSKTWHMTVKIL